VVATASENRLTDYQANGAMDLLTSGQSTEHFQQSAEFLPLSNRGLGPITVAVLSRCCPALPLSPREDHAPRLGDPNPCDFECAAASDHAFRLCCRQPRTDQFVQLPDREAVHQHDRFGAAVGARGKEFQRAPAVGLGAAPAAWGWHLIFLRIRPFQIESVRFELRFCFFEARRVRSTDDAWERHGLFRCGAFIAARSHRSSINIRKRPPNIWHQL
jgi:hypothetical protein